MKYITINTKNTTYQMGVNEYGFLLHIYYGPRTEGDMGWLLTGYDRGFAPVPTEYGTDRRFSMDVQPAEYPVYGNGDYRPTAFSLVSSEGVNGCDLRYVSHTFEKGKYSLKDLPSVYSDDERTETLTISLEDKFTGIRVDLLYGILFDKDIITRSVRVTNNGTEKVNITNIASACLDFLSGEYELVHFHGRHCMERNVEITSIDHGCFSIESIRGASSHQHNPFVILKENGADEDSGSCYGMMLLYSSNFRCSAIKDQMNQTRLMMGISPDMFSWELQPGSVFEAPEAALSFSGKGISELSQNYHKLIRENICLSPYKDKLRPVLLNSWEAVYFDFDGEKLIRIAEKASELGMELFVVDDGWFKGRNSDFTSLGDWQPDEEKLGMSMGELSDRIRGTGMKFGLWIEPEMISEDSQLFKEHPEWVMQIPGRSPVRSRSQLCIDFSNFEAVDYIYSMISKVLRETKADYVKIDLNRNLYDVYSSAEAHQNAGMTMHKNTIGVYYFMKKLCSDFPELLIEGCAGGGGRFDAGMMQFTAQIWCSDDTDAVERLFIHNGTSYGYPASVIGSHVSVVPNHQTGRITPFRTRGYIALAGTGFGYELNPSKLNEEETDLVKHQIALYKKYGKLIYEGLYYRFKEPVPGKDTAAYGYVSEDRSEALAFVIHMNVHGNAPVDYVRFKGLDPSKIYIIDDGECRSEIPMTGAALMAAGWPIPAASEEYETIMLHLKSVL